MVSYKRIVNCLFSAVFDGDATEEGTANRRRHGMLVIARHVANADFRPSRLMSPRQ